MTNVDYNRLLVVDDEISICRYLAGVARRMDFDVSIATDLDRLKHKIFSFSPAIILLDLQMPGMSGAELQQRLIERGIDLPVIVVTAYRDHPMTERVRAAGAHAVLAKPFDEAVLVREIDAALHAR